MFKKIPLVFLSVLSLMVFFAGCTKPDITFGESYLDNSFTNVVSVDTATPVVSTVFVDSFVTSATGRAVAGTYTDPLFGNVTAQSYFQVAPPSFSDIYTTALYDSIELVLKPDKSFYGDTTVPLTLTVNQLTQRMAYAENKTSFFNLNSFPADQNSLGTKTVTIRPSVTDTIAIRLKDEIGLELLSKFKTAQGDITTSDKFIEYFKGIRVSASGYMLGFSDSVIMRLHYRQPGVFQQNKVIDFTLSNNGYQFNQISVDRTSTPLSGLNSTKKEIFSGATNNSGFLQSVTGSVIKISFPYIRNFLLINQFVKVVRAELIVKPIKGSFSGYYPLPPQLRLSQTTLSNDFGTDINYSGTTSPTTQYGNLNIDLLYGANTEYTYDLTDYIVAQMAVTGYNANGLLLSPPPQAFTSNFNRLVIGDKNNPNGNIQLKLYYLTVAK